MSIFGASSGSVTTTSSNSITNAQLAVLQAKQAAMGYSPGGIIPTSTLGICGCGCQGFPGSSRYCAFYAPPPPPAASTWWVTVTLMGPPGQDDTITRLKSSDWSISYDNTWARVAEDSGACHYFNKTQIRSITTEMV
jgi:hypothetical protein